MHNLPLEVARKIFAHACFDDKLTGCSLSLTSKWINVASKPVRFQVVSLYGPSQISHFASILQRSPGVHYVNHLFISGVDIETAEMQRAKTDLRLRKRALQLNLIPIPEGEIVVETDDRQQPFRLTPQAKAEKRREQAFNDAFNTVIQHVAPSIQTLFITSLPATSPTLPSIPMPNLISLSVTAVHRSFTLPNPFPNLRRIHTDASIYVYGRHKELFDFRNKAPVLEEMRVTGIGQASSSFVHDVVAYSKSLQSDDENLLFSRAMKRVILQQSSPPYGAWCGNAYIEHSSFTAFLYDSANTVAKMEERGSGFRLVLLHQLDIPLWLKGKAGGLFYTFHDARRDWQDVISGGKGCWDDSQADATTIPHRIDINYEAIKYIDTSIDISY